MTNWLGVVHAEHVRRGVSLGIAQLGHGKRSPLARLQVGDTLFYYSPRERIGDTLPLKQFTAVGLVSDGEIYQGDEGDFRPYRRQIDYQVATAVPLDQVKSRLDLTSTPNWGYSLRLGLIPLTDHDATILRTELLRDDSL